MARMAKAWRWLILAGALLAVLALVVFAVRYQGGSQKREWEALTRKRRVNLVCRTFPSFAELFLRRGGGNVRPMVEMIYDGYGSNKTDLHGLLVDQGREAGYLQANVFYRDWEPMPTSAEYWLSIEPAFIPELTGDWKRLADLTAKEKMVERRLGDLEWTSSFGEKGELQIGLRIPYPSRWMEDIPDYDRGFYDQFRFDLLPRTLRLLYRSVMSDRYTPLALEPASFNPPGSESGGYARGFFRTKDGLVRVEFTVASTFGMFPKRTVEVVIGRQQSGEGDPKMDAAVGTLVKPELLKGLGEPDRPVSVEGAQMWRSPGPGGGRVMLAFPEDVLREKVDLDEPDD